MFKHVANRRLRAPATHSVVGAVVSALDGAFFSFTRGSLRVV